MCVCVSRRAICGGYYTVMPVTRTRSDKMSNATSWNENRTVCHTIRFLSYEV